MTTADSRLSRGRRSRGAPQPVRPQPACHARRVAACRLSSRRSRCGSRPGTGIRDSGQNGFDTYFWIPTASLASDPPSSHRPLHCVGRVCAAARPRPPSGHAAQGKCWWVRTFGVATRSAGGRGAGRSSCRMRTWSHAPFIQEHLWGQLRRHLWCVIPSSSPSPVPPPGPPAPRL